MMRYQAGDAAAFDELYLRDSPRVYGLVRKYISNEQQANDLFQATFLRIHTSRSAFKKDHLIAPWFLTITKNTVIDYLRKQRAESSRRSDIEIDNLPQEKIEQKIEQETEHEINLSGLGEDQKKAIRMRYMNSFSFSQIALNLHTTEANVRKIISRGLKKLRGNK